MVNAFEHELFDPNIGFRDDVTLLNADNMNALVKAILENKISLDSINSILPEKSNDYEIKELLKTINKSVFGVNTTPELTQSLKDKIESLSGSMSNADQNITGLSNQIKDIKGTVDDHSESVGELIEDMGSLQTNVGKLQTASNQHQSNITTLSNQISGVEGEMKRFIDNDVIVHNPSVSIDYAMYGTTKYTNPHYAVVGSDVQLPTVYLNFFPGEYKYNKTTGVKLISILAHNADTNEFVQEASNTGVNGNYISIPKKIRVTEGEYNLEFRCSHNSGTVTPQNNIGEEATNRIQEGQIVTPDKFTIIGYYEGCYCGTSTSTLSPSQISSIVIPGLNKSGKPYISGNKYTFTVPQGSGTIILACPSEEKGPKKVINTTVGAPMTTLFGEANFVKKVTLTNGKEYSVWLYSPASPYENEIELEVTLG